MDAADIEALVAPVTDPAPRETEVDAEGWVYEPASGAVIWHENVKDFGKETTEDINFALRLRGSAEARILALEAQKRALCENFDTLIREQRRRLSWWDWRLGPAVEAFARRMLAGSKKRTWICAWGRVSFRKSKGHTEILDDREAVEFVRQWAPEHVKVVETVGVKGVLAALEAVRAEFGEEAEVPNWLRTSEERETVKIETGIHISKKGNDDGDGDRNDEG